MELLLLRLDINIAFIHTNDEKGASASEVEIDLLTGEHQQVASHVVMDVGRSLNPAVDIGQVEGAFVQGLGLFTMEEQLFSPNGSLLTRGPG